MSDDWINQDNDRQQLCFIQKDQNTNTSAFLIDYERMGRIETSLNSPINALHIYEVPEDKIKDTCLKLITLGDIEVIDYFGTNVNITFSSNGTLSIITSNLILGYDCLGDYMLLIEWLEGLDDVKVVTNPKIDIIKELKGNQEKSTYKALKKKLRSFIITNSTYIDKLIKK